MHIISPDWIYLKNKIISNAHSLLIDGSVIIDVLNNAKIDTQYKKCKKYNYSDMILMPSFAEGFLNLDECERLVDKNTKIKNLISHGVTNIQIYASCYQDILDCDLDELINYTIIIELNGRENIQNKINEMNRYLDFYKNNPNIQFSALIRNISDFNKDMLTKLISILNEINIKIIIDYIEISHEEKKLPDLLIFLEDINFFNNQVSVICKEIENVSINVIKSKDILLMIPHESINTNDSMSMIEEITQNNIPILYITDKSNIYDPYKIFKIQKFILNQKDKLSFDKICYGPFSYNASEIFSKFNYDGIIKKGSLACFNLFDIGDKFLLKDTNYKPMIDGLDSRSLCHVWSAGKKIYSRDK